MPRFDRHLLFASDEVRLARVQCDGQDDPRARREVVAEDRVWVVLGGCFAFRSWALRSIVDPSNALFLRAGEEFVVRHPRHGGDLCLVVSGPLARSLCAKVRHVARRPLSVADYIQLHALVARLRAGPAADPLATAVVLCETLGPPASEPRSRPHDRLIADVIAHEIGQRFEERLSLAHLAALAEVSVFHACRAFRRVTGTSIHRHQREIRLRHALALILDTRRALAEIAIDTGFANQAHLTSCFRLRFGLPPARVRAQARVS
ncbi:MAG TPA: helix-turn-helix transcriptional regulator [Polyangia bacterium]|nr:helix-turn-helix transcriptional regulator [Polyangia bacterium]